MLILILCAELHQDTTYHDVLRSMGGKRAQQLAAISIMCTCFGINFFTHLSVQHFVTHSGTQEHSQS
ncbi:hypothetical protein QR98_0001200 [Sarcoptes scabiei]|uniref:Uncharacterized protein n=1 Tax=Sarcoptes scabiei TaxID=52283 RepID=A0A131ZT43_SARSC|nr:hypothetical protein QR98_0001200 [Sarcoptes scabiei]